MPLEKKQVQKIRSDRSFSFQPKITYTKNIRFSNKGRKSCELTLHKIGYRICIDPKCQLPEDEGNTNCGNFKNTYILLRNVEEIYFRCSQKFI